MEKSVVPVTTQNWPEVVHMIDWRQPEMVDRHGNRILLDIHGTIRYQIPFDVWYDTKAYSMLWRRFVERGGNSTTA
ncbi:MAG TPA: hypothetical protein VHI13_13405 [Candidatus Kapabacteria bacterium]|nr:hypothetical protein [Candidatus Kapabacteria bacterium]